MIEELPRCENPACGKVLIIIPGHRRRQYCDDACKMAARRARIAVENQARYEALQLELARRECEALRQRWGDLLPSSLDLLVHVRKTCGMAVAEQVATALRAERDEARKSLAEERETLIDAIMLTGEQLDFPPIVTEVFELVQGVFAWSSFCGNASVEALRLAREAAYLKLQARNGRLKLGEQT